MALIDTYHFMRLSVRVRLGYGNNMKRYNGDDIHPIADLFDCYSPTRKRLSPYKRKIILNNKNNYQKPQY